MRYMSRYNREPKMSISSAGNLWMEMRQKILHRRRATRYINQRIHSQGRAIIHIQRSYSQACRFDQARPDQDHLSKSVRLVLMHLPQISEWWGISGELHDGRNCLRCGTLPSDVFVVSFNVYEANAVVRGSSWPGGRDGLIFPRIGEGKSG